MIDIPLEKLNYTFMKRPLVVGGKAMEYYDLRKAGEDIDLIAAAEDVVNLIKLYPNRTKDLWGDLAACPFEFEIWKTITYYDYDYLVSGAIDEGKFLVISMDKLLLLKACAIKKEKYLNDTKLLGVELEKRQYSTYPTMSENNKKLLSGIENVEFIERIAPENS